MQNEKKSNLSVAEAAEQLDVSPSLVYQWCAEKRLPHFRLGRRGRRGTIRIQVDELSEFMKCLRVESAASDEPALGKLKHISQL